MNNKKDDFNWRFLVTIVIVVIFIMSLVWLFDNGFNGFLAQWFERSFLEDAYGQDSEGNFAFTPNIVWHNMRNFLVSVSLVLAVTCAAIIQLCVHFKKRKIRREVIADVGGLIHDYMLTDRTDVLHISRDYMEIENELLQIKAQMQNKEQKLKDESARKNDLITYLAHDLKTPLTSVIGYLSLLDEAYDMPDDQRRKYVKITLSKAERLEKLTQEFFEITRYNLSSIVLEKERFDLYYLFVQLIDEFYPILEPAGKRVVLHADEDLTYYGDSEKLARVFNNILKNAAAYSYDHTDIHIFAEQEKDNLVISFRNEGRQIPENKLQSIFDKFFRLDEARTTNSGGAGLGLAIAKEIVTLHGGTIEAFSAEHYTVFTVRLPVSGAAAGRENILADGGQAQAVPCPAPGSAGCEVPEAAQGSIEADGGQAQAAPGPAPGSAGNAVPEMNESGKNHRQVQGRS